MKKISIKVSMLIMFVSIIVGLSIIANLTAKSMKSTFINEQVVSLKEIINIAYKEAEFAYKTYGDNDIAKQKFYDILKNFRYGKNNKEYVFIYDTKGTNLFHPTKPNRVGKNYWESGDAKGYKYMQEFARISKASKEGGVVEYSWKNPKDGNIYTKQSWTMLFEPWDMMIATGVLIKDAEEKANKAVIKIMYIIALVGLALIALIALITTLIMVKIEKTTKAMNALAENNLDVAIPYMDRNDEIGKMAKCLSIFKQNSLDKKQMQENEEIAKKELEEKAQSRLMDITSSISDTANEVEMDISGISTAASELSSTLEQVNGQIESMGSSVSRTFKSSEDGVRTINSLNDASNRIGEVIKLIKDIAGKTNLLALNASIEAARAGDMGRGFAVVAEEVKKLASQTSSATADIEDLIKGIQSSSNSSVEVINTIQEQMKEVSDFAESLSVSMAEQQTATSDIAERMVRASEGAIAVSSKIKDVRNIK